LENAQDGILRSLYESSGGTLTSVSDDELSIEQCIAWMNADRAGSRLNAESIGAWFDSSCADAIVVTAAEKLQTDNVDDPRIVATVKRFRDMLCMLTGKSAVTQVQLDLASRALDISECDDEMAQKLRQKITDLSPKITADSAALDI